MSRIRNYDETLLRFWIAEPGFIIGEGIIGVNRIGGDQTPVQINADFISMTIDSPCTVESGLFVYREVRQLTLVARVTAPINYDGKRILVEYNGFDMFYGTIRQYDINESWTTAVNTPEGIPYREYTVTITAMSGEERFAKASTPPRNFNGETSAERLSVYFGTTSTSVVDAEADINLGMLTNINDTVTEGHLVYASDSVPNLLESIRTQLRLSNQHYLYQPWDSDAVIASNARWLSGTDEASALTLTDNPADIVGGGGGDDFVHNDNVVGYTQRSASKNSSYFTRGVTITMTNNADVTTTYGPYRASNAFSEDIDVNIGRQSGAGPILARAVAATLPLRKQSQQFTYKLRTKLQSLKQIGIDAEGPGMAVLINQGVTSRIAILGVKHEVTRDEWTVEYDCGPEHLISRQSDVEPFIVMDFTLTENAPTQIKLDWTTPDLPGGQHYYVIFLFVGGLPIVSWDLNGNTLLSTHVAKASGEAESIFLSSGLFTSGPHTLGIFYTSDPEADSGNLNNAYTQGQPVFKTITMT